MLGFICKEKGTMILLYLLFLLMVFGGIVVVANHFHPEWDLFNVSIGALVILCLLTN